MHKYFKINSFSKITSADDAPAWFLDTVYKAHDGELPDEWRWAACEMICRKLAADWPHIYQDTIADDVLDEDIFDIIEWLGGHPGRIGYCDEVLHAAHGFDSTADLLRAGQRACIEEMVTVWVEAFLDNQEEDE
jgi:hypothetical protein